MAEDVDVDPDVALVLGTSGGGVGRHVRAVAAGLAERGHQVLVCGPAATDAAFGFSAAGVAFDAVEMADRPRPREDAVALRRLRSLLARAGVVHAHGLRAGGLAALALGGVRRRPSLIVTLHNAPPSGSGRVALLAHGALERIVARRADAILGVSPDLEERMRRLGAGDVGHAVVPAPKLPVPERGATDVRAAVGAGLRPLVLTVARLAEQKGLDVLLDAASIWAGRELPPLVAVAGDGPLYRSLHERIEREDLPVVLLGPRDDVPDLLGAADVVVVSSRWEGQPIFVQEAMRAGRPLVATDTGGTPAVVGGAAVLVPYGDAHRLAAEVSSLLDDEGRRNDLAMRAYDRAGQLPTDEEAVDALDALYARVRGGRPRGG